MTGTDKDCLSKENDCNATTNNPYQTTTLFFLLSFFYLLIHTPYQHFILGSIAKSTILQYRQFIAGGGFATKSRRSYCPRKADGFAAAFSGIANNTVVCNRGQYIENTPFFCTFFGNVPLLTNCFIFVMIGTSTKYQSLYRIFQH